VIYFVQAEDGGGIKIGTTMCLTARLGQLEKDTGCPLRVLGVIDGTFPEEKALHRKFKHLWLESEWFGGTGPTKGLSVDWGC